MKLEQKSTLPKMRTIADAAEEIRTMDPKTAVSAYYIRQLVQSGKIPVLHTGNKVIVNMDVLFSYIKMESTGGQYE